MRIKDLFTVPQGTKVTEKAFGRVLISSICSILLCMACLAGTSWAWFTASIDAGNIEIDIAPVTLKTQVKLGSETLTSQENGSYMLAQGEYKLKVALEREKPQSTAYVLVSIQQEDNKDYFFTFTFTPTSNKTPEVTLIVNEGTACVNFKVTWISPDGAEEIQDKGVITVGQPVINESENTDSDQTNTDSDQTNTGSNQPTTGSNQDANASENTNEPDPNQQQVQEEAPVQSPADPE